MGIEAGGGRRFDLIFGKRADNRQARMHAAFEIDKVSIVVSFKS